MHELLSVAPMMDLTDRHFRYLLRLIAKRPILYTEMITAKAILHGDKNRLLRFDPLEHPLVLQLGGSDPYELAEATAIAKELGYSAVNLNVGCPSDRVQNGQFGACLMAHAPLVAICVAHMQKHLPVSVKTRIGIDDQDSYDFLLNFIDIVAAAGCEKFIVHARKAWLQGLSPRENREIPPLLYERVYRLQSDSPQLKIYLNGGINSLADILEHLQFVPGVMLGRSIYEQPMLLASLSEHLFAETCEKNPAIVLRNYLPYLRVQVSEGCALSSIARHLVNLFHSQAGARKWRQYLSTELVKHQDPEQLLQFC